MSEYTGTPDLAGFTPEGRRLVREFLECGWCGKMSNSGHLILRAPDGEATYAIARKSQARGYRNARAFLARWMKLNVKENT